MSGLHLRERRVALALAVAGLALVVAACAPRGTLTPPPVTAFPTPLPPTGAPPGVTVELATATPLFEATGTAAAAATARATPLAEP